MLILAVMPSTGASVLCRIFGVILRQSADARVIGRIFGLNVAD